MHHGLCTERNLISQKHSFNSSKEGYLSKSLHHPPLSHSPGPITHRPGFQELSTSTHSSLLCISHVMVAIKHTRIDFIGPHLSPTCTHFERTENLQDVDDISVIQDITSFPLKRRGVAFKSWQRCRRGPGRRSYPTIER